MFADFESFKNEYEEEIKLVMSEEKERNLRSKASNWNDIGLKYLKRGYNIESEQMYRWALDRCKEVEEEEGILIHKGIELCNLALSLLALYKYTEAVIYLEQAEEEDKRIGQRSHAGDNIIGKKLLRNSLIYIDSYLNTYIYQLKQRYDFTNDEINLWEYIDRSRRLRLAVLMKQLHSIIGDTNTARLFRFGAMKEITLIIHSVLKEIIPGNSNFQYQLASGIYDVSSTIFHSFFPTRVEFNPSNIDVEINRIIHSYKINTVNDLMNCSILATYAIRNYTSHNDTVSINICSASDFNKIFPLLLLTLMRIKCPTASNIQAIALSLLQPYSWGCTPVFPSAEELRDYFMNLAIIFIPDYEISNMNLIMNDCTKVIIEFTVSQYDSTVEDFLYVINEEMDNYIHIYYKILDKDGNSYEYN